MMIDILIDISFSITEHIPGAVFGFDFFFSWYPYAAYFYTNQVV